MKILSSNFIKRFNNPILNIHPSLLPKYKGLNTHWRVINNNEPFTGATVHLVTEKLDSGKIILQKKVKVFKNDDDYKEIAPERREEIMVELIRDGIIKEENDTSNIENVILRELSAGKSKENAKTLNKSSLRNIKLHPPIQK